MSAPRDRQRGGALGAFLGVLLTVALLALFLEGGLRLVPLPLARPVVTINQPDATLGWVKRRGESTTKSTSEYDVTFTINDLGLRDDAGLTREKPDGQQRVLVLGDSFVLGYTVDRDDLFVDQVERALVADGRDVQVLNGGTEGWSTDQELIWLRQEGLSFQPDVVVLAFYENDVYWNGQRAYAGNGKPRFAAGTAATTPESFQAGDPDATGWLARHTALGGMFHRLTDPSGRDTIVQVGGQWMSRDETVRLVDPPPSLDLADCWDRTEACLRGLKATCAEAGLPLLVLSLPSREEIQPHSAEAWRARFGLTGNQVDFAMPGQRLAELVQSLDIPLLRPHDALRGAAEQQDLYYEHDWHLNPAGNRVVARELYQALTTPGFLGGTPAHEPALAAPPGATVPTWVWVLVVLWLVLGTLYARSYRDEKPALAYLKVAGLIGAVVLIVFGVAALAGLAGPRYGPWIGMGALVCLLGFLLVKSWSHLAIIWEVYWSFVRRGHWYMIPLLVAMLTIGNLLIVASSSPFVAPFIYTLF